MEGAPPVAAPMAPDDIELARWVLACGDNWELIGPILNKPPSWVLNRTMSLGILRNRNEKWNDAQYLRSYGLTHEQHRLLVALHATAPNGVMPNTLATLCPSVHMDVLARAWSACRRGVTEDLVWGNAPGLPADLQLDPDDMPRPTRLLDLVGRARSGRSFGEVLIMLLIYVRTYPQQGEHIGLAWGRGRDLRFYSNARTLSSHLDCKHNTVSHNFRDHGFTTTSAEWVTKRTPGGLVVERDERRGWKMRSHPHLHYWCTMPDAAAIAYIPPRRAWRVFDLPEDGDPEPEPPREFPRLAEGPPGPDPQ
jgi:hypothetical protein